MNRLLLVLAALGALFDMHSGYAPHYGRNAVFGDVMERVARKRHLPLVACMVSSPRYEVGTWVYVYGAKTDRLEYCRVTDVSHPRDRARHLRTKREVELSFAAAQRLCGSTKTRPTDCPITVVRVRR